MRRVAQIAPRAVKDAQIVQAVTVRRVQVLIVLVVPGLVRGAMVVIAAHPAAPIENTIQSNHKNYIWTLKHKARWLPSGWVVL